MECGAILDVVRLLLGGGAAPSAADAVHRRPPVPPAACWCARLVVLSMLCHSPSISVARAVNRAAQRPLFDQRSKRLNTVCQGPNSSGRSRHGTPVRRHHTTASKHRRSSAPGRPRRGWAANAAFTRNHGVSLIQGRVAMPRFDHAGDPRATSRHACPATDRNSWRHRPQSSGTGPKGPRVNNSLALVADASRLASLPAPVLGSHPSRMLPSGPRRRLAIRAPRPRSSIDSLTRGP